jgi:hypothetical protein
MMPLDASAVAKLLHEFGQRTADDKIGDIANLVFGLIINIRSESWRGNIFVPRGRRLTSSNALSNPVKLGTVLPESV